MTTSFLNTSHQTIRWFAKQSGDGLLTLRPPFQRRPVWNNEQKSLLIDTVLRGYPVPEIYVSVMPGADGEDVTAIVDGQQRLRACLEFLADAFPIKFDIAKLEPLHGTQDTPWLGKYFSELSDDEKKSIERYKLIVRDLEGMSQDQVRHLFHRLNQSTVALNAQELRFSMYSGGLLETVERLNRRREWDHFGVFTPAQRRRMLDSEFISELVIGHLHWPQNKKDNLDRYYRSYSNSFPFGEEVSERFSHVLQVLQRVFPEERMSGTRWYRKSDFYTLFLALSRNRIPLPEDTLAEVSLRAALEEFSALVSGSEELPEFSPASIYRFAVSRAATDRTRRVRREEALQAFLAGEWSMDVPSLGEEAGGLDDDSDEPDDAELDVDGPVDR